MSYRTDLDAPEHAICSHALLRAREALETRTVSWLRATKRAEAAEAEVARLREALEEISDGAGCDSKYGPGCDTHCKTIAYRALDTTSDQSPTGGKTEP